MGCVRTCDICGREEREIDYGRIEHYKMKKENRNPDLFEPSWERLDICDECMREIQRAVKNKGVVRIITNNNLDSLMWPLMDEYLASRFTPNEIDLGVPITAIILRGYLEWYENKLKEEQKNGESK